MYYVLHCLEGHIFLGGGAVGMEYLFCGGHAFLFCQGVFFKATGSLEITGIPPVKCGTLCLIRNKDLDF